jgi:hypothetical protein
VTALVKSLENGTIGLELPTTAAVRISCAVFTPDTAPTMGIVFSLNSEVPFDARAGPMLND